MAYVDLYRYEAGSHTPFIVLQQAGKEYMGASKMCLFTSVGNLIATYLFMNFKVSKLTFTSYTSLGLSHRCACAFFIRSVRAMTQINTRKLPGLNESTHCIKPGQVKDAPRWCPLCQSMMTLNSLHWQSYMVWICICIFIHISTMHAIAWYTNQVWFFYYIFQRYEFNAELHR